MMIELVEAMKEWTARNPLRTWRAKHRLTQALVATYVDVSEFTVGMWESGSATPTQENMTKLAVLMVSPELHEQWAEWETSRPKVQQ